MRPLGRPPTPSAKSSCRLPVGMTSTWVALALPSFITEPLPKSFSILPSATSSAFFLSSPNCRVAGFFSAFFSAAIAKSSNIQILADAPSVAFVGSL